MPKVLKEEISIWTNRIVSRVIAPGEISLIFGESFGEVNITFPYEIYKATGRTRLRNNKTEYEYKYSHTED